MSNEIQFQVRRVCKHNRIAPHTVIITNISTGGTAEESWCTDGDTSVRDLFTLETLIDEVLSTVHPRMERKEAEIKAGQIVERLEGLLR